MGSQILSPVSTYPTLVDVLQSRAAHSPERVAYRFLTDGETQECTVTYQDLDRRARAIAAALQSMVGPGDRALLLFPSGLDYATAFLGCMYAGVIAVPAYPPKQNNRSLPRIQAILRDAQPAIVLSTSSIWHSRGLFRELVADSATDQWLATDTVPDELACQWQPVELNEDSLCFLQYTSGSTSTPKGVMVSHSNLISNFEMQKSMWHVEEGSVTVSWLPFFHDFGLIGFVLSSLYTGAPCVIMSPMDFVQRPFRWLKAISQYEASVSGAPSFAYDLCVRKITPEQRAELDLSSWHTAVIGAEPVRQPTLEQFTQTFASCGFRKETFYPCYGLAEATLVVSGGEKSDPPVFYSVDRALLERGQLAAAKFPNQNSGVLVGCGHTWAGQEIAIVDPETHRRCPSNRMGEVWVQGACVAQGYWKRQEETAAVFQACIEDTGEGPFMRTGDLGFMKDGELFISGRIKDLIIIDGLNYHPQDIELTIEDSHPAIRGGSTIAFSADIQGQERLVVACEIDRHWKADTRDTIVDTAREAIAKVHEVRVHEVVLLKAGGIPKTSSGKLQRQACRCAYLDGTLAKLGEDE